MAIEGSGYVSSDSRCVPLVWLLLTSAFWIPMQAYSASTDAMGILSAVKAATGGDQWDRITTWRERGAYEMGDMKGTYEAWLNFPQSLFYRNYEMSSPAVGPIRATSGWNGRISWSSDQTGDVVIAESEEARHNAASAAYITTFAYLFRGRSPAEMTVLADRTVNGEQFQIVRVNPGGAEPFELWVDPVAHWVKRIVELKGVGRTSTTFSDFRVVAGLTVPFQARESGLNREALLSESNAATIEINLAPPHRIFDPPQATLAELRFPDGRDSVTLEARYIDDAIYIPVSVNGRLQKKFAFDTGSTNTISMSEAQALGLKVVRAGVGYGAGLDSTPNGLTFVNQLEVGGLIMKDQIVETTVLTGEVADSVDGMIGYELARQCIVVIDYASHHITLVKPGTFHPAPRAVAMPFRFAQPTEILVTASVDGIQGDFQLDTGQGAALTVNRPFAERNGLLAKYREGRRGTQAGVGGVAPTIFFTPAQFSIGKFRPSVATAQIFDSASGSGAEEHVAGVIGNDILKQFVVTLDYAHRRVYFEKNGTFGKLDPEDIPSAETFDMGRPRNSSNGREGWLGLIKLRRQGDRPLHILKLEPDGPAARSGILEGDEIIALNGIPVENLTGRQVAGLLISAPGTPVTFTILRGGQKKAISVNTI